MTTGSNDACTTMPAFSGCLTIAGFCRWSGLGRTKVYELIKARDLRPLKCGRRTLIAAEEARRWRDALPNAHETGGADGRTLTIR